jgi:signal transduction histidine kinase
MLIRDQLRLSFIATLLVLLVGGATLIYIYNRARQAEEMRSWAAAVAKVVFECNIFGSEYATLEAERAREQFQKSSDRLAALLAEAPGKGIAAKPLEDLHDRKTRMDSLVRRMEVTRAERTERRSDNELDAELKKMLTSQIQLHSQAILYAAIKFREQASRQGAQLWHITVLCGALMIGLILTSTAGTLLFCYRRILVPLDQLADAARHFGNGKLETRVPAPHPNEFGIAARSFNAMAERLVEREEELKQKIKDMDTLCYSIAHDLKAPLRAVAGFSKVLEEDFAEKLGSEGRSYLDKMQGGALRMDELIDGLLQYGALAHRELKVGPVDLEEVWKEMLLDGVQEETDRRGALLQKQGTLPSVQGNAFVLRTVLRNLVTNGLKYGPPGGNGIVIVRAERVNDKVLLFVQDNGIGIAPEHQDRIFGLFERLHSREEYEGNGLGLAMARRGIERLGGKLGVVSQVGSGSTFSIELPAEPNARRQENWELNPPAVLEASTDK